MSWLVSTVVTAVIASATAPAASAEPPPKVRLEVDTSALTQSSATNSLERWLTQDQMRTILDGGLEVSPDAPITIRVAIRRYGEHDANYEATLTLVDVESGMVHEERMVTCEMCTDGQLITKLSPDVARLAARVLYAPVQEPQEPEEPEERPQEQDQPAEPDPAPEPTTRVPPPPKPIGPLGAGGIASAVVGLGAMGAGIGLALAPERWRLVRGTVEHRDARPAGLALVGVGAALVTTGAVLVAVDMARRQKARRVSVTPELTGSSATVSFGVRF